MCFLWHTRVKQDRISVTLSASSPKSDCSAGMCVALQPYSSIVQSSQMNYGTQFCIWLQPLPCNPLHLHSKVSPIKFTPQWGLLGKRLQDCRLNSLTLIQPHFTGCLRRTELPYLQKLNRNAEYSLYQNVTFRKNCVDFVYLRDRITLNILLFVYLTSSFCFLTFSINVWLIYFFFFKASSEVGAHVGSEHGPCVPLVPPYQWPCPALAGWKQWCLWYLLS